MGSRMVNKIQSLKQFSRNLTYKVALGLLIFFFVFFGWREEIAPSFLKNVVPLDTMAKIVFPVMLLPFVPLVFSVIYVLRCSRRSRGRKEKNRLISQSILKVAPWFLGCLAFELIFCDVLEQSARDKVKSFLGTVSTHVIVSVDGQKIKDPIEVINELKKIGPLTPHWSHAKKTFRVEVRSKRETLALQLGRDSSRAREYWVFYPKYRYTSKNEIGRITTNLFDDY